MRIAVVGANLGGFEKERPYESEQSIGCDFYHFDDKNFPPRYNSMTPRLQARIVKMFMWQMVPGYDIYVWIDSSMAITHKDTVKWFLEQLGGNDIAVFKHPHRKTIQEEADYLKERLRIKCPYITPRYANEDIDGQLKEVNPEDQLLASTAFIYKDSEIVRCAMKEWWYHTSRYHSIDQLSLPYVLGELYNTSDGGDYLDIKVINENYLKIPYLTYVRNK